MVVTPTRLDRVEYFVGDPGDGGKPLWYVRIVAANGETMLVSEGYTTKWGAKRAAKRFAYAFDTHAEEVYR